MRRRTRAWFAHRFGFDAIRRHVLHRRTPKGAWYQGDGAALTLLLGIQIITGLALSLSYNPSPERAHASVVHVSNVQFLGGFVRALHYWSAGMMVVMIVWHLLRQILLGGYKSPREGTWLVGVAMFFLILMLSLTGYALRWDQTGISALRVALSIFSAVPFVGDGLVRFVQGGDDIGAQTLTRLFAAHVIIFPLITLGLVAHHLYLVIRHGITSVSERDGASVRSAEDQRAVYEADARSSIRGERFYPRSVVSSGMFASAVLVIVLLLAGLAGAPPLLESAGSHPARTEPAEEWWFSWWSALAGILPGWIAPKVYVAIPLVVLIVLVALPFVDRGPRRGMRKRPIAVASVVLVVASLLLLSDIRRRSSWHAYPIDGAPPMPAGRMLSDAAEQGRQLFASYGCTSCHAVAGWGRPFAPDLAQPSRTYSQQELVAYIRQPPKDVAMPAYIHRASAEEIELLAAYVLVVQTLPRE